MANPSLARIELLNRIAQTILQAQAGEEPLRVAIDGIDTAGKTTLANELADVLAEKGCPIVRASIDGFHRPRAERYARGADSPEGYYLDSFNHAALIACLLEPLGPGGSRLICTSAFDFHTDRPRQTPWQSAPPGCILLFDGVFLLRPELRPYWDFSIFVEIDYETALQRALVRDLALFGEAAEVERRYRQRYIPGQQLYFEEARPREHANLIVDNRNPAAPEFLKAARHD